MKINDKRISSAKTVYEFDVLWKGWELDSTGWVMKDDIGTFLVLSDHDSKYISNRNELIDKITEYEILIQNTKLALELI